MLDKDGRLRLEELFARATAPEGDSALVMPRALVVFAHPDDEVIALGGRLGRFGGAHLVHVTDGAPLDEADSRAHGFRSLAEYRRAREGELRRALAVAGVADVSRECLGIPDQEASLRLLTLTRSVDRLIERWRPEVVFTHPYEGGHPDHDACAFAVRQAVGLRTGQDGPLVIEAAFYHAGPEGIATGCFLPDWSRTQTVTYRLSPGERARKQAMMDCFTSQAETLRQFSTECEMFRVAPEYDFCRPPQAERVFYDSFPWGMTSGRFCELAAETENALQDVGQISR